MLLYKGNWFLKDYMIEFEKYDKTCEHWQNLTEIPVELNDLKEIKSKSEFLEKFTKRKKQLNIGFYWSFKLIFISKNDNIFYKIKQFKKGTENGKNKRTKIKNFEKIFL